MDGKEITEYDAYEVFSHSKYDSEKINYSTDDNLDIDDLEEKIRVDKEPSWINNCMLDQITIFNS